MNKNTDKVQSYGHLPGLPTVPSSTVTSPSKSNLSTSVPPLYKQGSQHANSTGRLIRVHSADDPNEELDKIPKWVLVKLRDEMKARQIAERQLEELKELFDERIKEVERKLKESHEQKLEQIKGEYESKLEEQTVKELALKSELAKQIEHSSTATEEKYEAKLKETEKNLREALEDKEKELTIAKAELAYWGVGSNKDIPRVEDEDETKVDMLEFLAQDPPRRGRTSSMIEDKMMKKRHKKKEEKEKKTKKSTHSLLDTVNAYRSSIFDTPPATRELHRHTVQLSNLSLQLQNELAKRQKLHKHEKELSEHCHQLQLKISLLVTTREKISALVKEATEQKKRLPEIEKKLLQKRKELEDITKDLHAQKLLKQEEKFKRECEENSQSIIKEINLRKTLLKHTPKHYTLTCNDILEVSIFGPSDSPEESPRSSKELSPTELEAQQALAESVCGKSVSTYPMKNSGVREGDPICDRFCITHYEHCTVFALGDGCGWGSPSKEAAIKATTVFVEYMKKFKQDIQHSRLAARLMLRALSTCHESIIEGTNEETLFMAGTTTILGGIVLPMASKDTSSEKLLPSHGKHVLTFVSLGDCKAYLFSASTSNINDITIGNRKNATDAKDPGGRLGPYKQGGAPDLRNLIVYSQVCFEGDIIVVLSDGVHDNFDPQSLGKTPKDLGIDAIDNSWSNVVDHEEALKKKALWSEAHITQIIHGGDTPNNNQQQITPSLIAERLLCYVVKLTAPSREFMEKNPNIKLPADFQKYPGKMDHTTVLAFRVGRKSKLIRTNSSSGSAMERLRTLSL